MNAITIYSYVCIALIIITGVSCLIFGILMITTEPERDIKRLKYRIYFILTGVFGISNIALQVLFVVGNVVAAYIK